MRRVVLMMVVCACCVALYGQTAKWREVVRKDRYGDYEGVKRVLDTMRLESRQDSVKWYEWMGQYYYWLSYEERGKGEEARRCYERAIEFGKRNHVSGMPYGYYWLHLGELEYLYGDYDRAIASMSRALGELPYKIKRSSQRIMKREPWGVYKGLGMCYAMKGDYARALQYLDSCKGMESGATSVTRMRGKVLALKGDKKGAKRCYEQFVEMIREEVKDSFLTLEDRRRESWWMSVRPFITDCWRLEDGASELLYDVALLSKGILLQERGALEYRSADVRKAMDKDEVAIEWMMYEKDGEKRYGAVVMRKSGKVTFVETGTVSEINEWIYENEEMMNKMNAEMIWSKRMMRAIGGARKVYFAPDGALNQLGIEYMFPDTARQLYRLSSTRELIKRRRVDGQKRAAVMGGMEYDALLKGELGRGNDDLAYRHLQSLRYRARWLEHSKPECVSVVKMRGNEGDTLITGEGATEMAFRRVAGNYGVMLLSTHGYCGTKERFESSDFPRKDVVDRSLSESGLLFSGVNRELKERHGDYDGIVSAKELSQMDLSGVDVCVVSACEGARGKVSVDGTYGIQRGLKAAGVGGMVLSLWKVNDVATGIFMEYFFKAIKESGNVHDAFWKARNALKNHEETRGNRPKGYKKFDKPYYYNAFILVDVL